MDEGYIKFNCKWIEKEIKEDIDEINKWRDKLYSLGVIGVYSNGIGFGNLSIKDDGGIIITGSDTGKFEKLINKDYSKIVGKDFKKNLIICEGLVKASSESLTHLAIYESDPKTNAVIHAHNKDLWEKLLGKLPTTNKDIAYGTPEMAYEIFRIFQETDIRKKKILVMGGHEEGIISFGKNLDEAGKILLEQMKN